MDRVAIYRCFLLLVLLFLNHATSSPSSKHVFKRIVSSEGGVHSSRCALCPTTTALRNRHRCASANDGRLYFLSLKGKRQPSFGSYHETALYGGYLSVYDRRRENSNSSSSWSHFHFDVIDNNENREDAFFVLKNTLFLLIYTRFENVTFRRLLQWSERGKRWTPLSLEVDERAEFRIPDDFGDSIQNGALAWTTNLEDQGRDPKMGRAYLVATNGWGRMKVSELEVIFDYNTDHDRDRSSTESMIAKSAVIRFVTEDTDGNAAVNFAGAILALAHRSGVLYAFYGTRGCGFHWEKRSLITIDLLANNNSRPSIDRADLDDRTDRSPPWAFNGPALVEQDGPNWVMFGGSVAGGGETGAAQFDRRVWIFNLDSRRWKKSKMARLPDRLNIYETCSAIDRRARIVYLADFNNIYKAHLERL